MKKLISALLAILIVLTLSACSSGNQTNEKEANVVNPLNELTSLDELCKEINMALYKYEGDGVEEEHYRLIDSEYKVGEYEIKFENIVFTIRTSKAPYSVDISGIYFDGNQLYSSYLDSEETVYIDNDEYLSARWFTLDGQYVAYTKQENVEFYIFQNFIQLTQDIKPFNWNSEVPYEDYKNICGYYADEDLNLTTISIKDDHAYLTVSIAEGDGSLTYEMDAVLKDGELVYEEAKVSYFEYNYETDESIHEERPSLKEGSIKVEDGVVSFANSGIEKLINSTMTFISF